jgi:hypothetical protein
MPSQSPVVIYVDIDDTLIRSIGSKRIPITAAINHVRSLHADGAHLYCWSTGGNYAHTIAKELNLDHCFLAFLPKPQILLDDQPPAEWRRLITIHPLQCESQSLINYRQMLDTGNRPAT